MPNGASKSFAREAAGIACLLVLGLGTRIAFATAYPTLPFWDSLGLIHFATRLQEHGLTADGWHWAQFNTGLPMILSLLFRLFPADPIVVARTATAVITGLLALIPLLVWRSVLAFRWRFLAGAMLALWPGQIFFSGVVMQDNWAMLPAVALGSLAARRMLGGDRARPVVAGLLYAGAVAIRQEMLVVLLPLALAASLGRGAARRRTLVLLGLTVSLPLLALCAQRHAATGRFSLSTEHGALGLFGSFMPGASGPGWIDARAYAGALAPDAPKKVFGDQPTLLRLTLDEIQRRPGLHLMRIASWLPRLALTSDSDNLVWSLGAPQSQSEDRRASAQALQRRWLPRLEWELAIIQGLFLVTVLIGLARRDAAILTLSAAVLLKFMVHMVVSPLGRLVVPAVALELLAIPLGMRELAHCSLRHRLLGLAGAASTSLLLLLAVPRLTNFVVRHDSPVLQGVRRFELHLDGGGIVRCELVSGALTGIGPKWASLRTTPEEPSPRDLAKVTCELPASRPGETQVLNLYDPNVLEGIDTQRTERIHVNGRETLRRDMTVGSVATQIISGETAAVEQPSTISIELIPGPGAAAMGRGRDASVRFDFVRTGAEERYIEQLRGR